MELTLSRQTLRFERLVTQAEEQVTIEGEATLPGSMRDAVTVLSVQAQACLTGAQALAGEVLVKGHVCFQTLYTQGDLTRIRTLETSCDFEHRVPLEGAAPQMRVYTDVGVAATQGTAASGRMNLRALLCLGIEVFEEREVQTVSQAQDMQERDNLYTRMQSVEMSSTQIMGEGRTLVREEFDLPDRLCAGDVLSAYAFPREAELSGGSGRTGVSGILDVRVLHRPLEGGGALVTTDHELPYELTIAAQLPDGAQPRIVAEVTDVMADAAAADKGRVLRIEAQISVRLELCSQTGVQLLEDLYSLRGEELVPVREQLDVHTKEEAARARESLRLQAALPQDAPPMDKVLAAFAVPSLAALTPSGRRLEVEGVMQTTLIYLPADSDIPCAVHTREPFAVTFPVETGEGVRAQLACRETAVGPVTSDRAELRCVLEISTRRHETKTVSAVTDVEARPEEKREHGFILVWPAPGESRWETARRLRVAPDSLKQAGKNALLALRR